MNRTKIACLLLLAPVFAGAEIVSSSETHYILRHDAESALSPDALWQRLINPSAWWHPEHTYSGNAANLSLDAVPGGLWKETWDGGSVAHGEVLLIVEDKTLRMNAPFGPLQGVGAYTIWTISIAKNGEGSTVRFDESAIAPPSAKLDELAAAVDFVKSEAMRRLTASGPGFTAP